MDLKWAVVVGLFVLCSAFVLGIVATLLNIKNMLTRTPPLSEELYRDFCTKSELTQLRAEYLKTMAEAFDTIRRLQAAVEQEMRNQSAALARIEGKLENCPGADVCAQLRAMLHGAKG
jgi:hypothetical protein